MPHVRRHLLSAVIASTCLTCAPQTHGEEANNWQPVDQSVSDLDLRAVSTRHVERGIGVFGQTGSLFQRPTTAGWYIDGQHITQTYQFRQPGYTALIDRPEYLVQDGFGEMFLNTAPERDGQFIDLVPPNTVYDLSNSLYHVYIPFENAYENDAVSPRVDTRVQGWVDESAGQNELAPPPPVAHRLPAHLMARRAEQRAKEAQEQSESIESDDTQAPDAPSTDAADNTDEPASSQDEPTQTQQD